MNKHRNTLLYLLPISILAILAVTVISIASRQNRSALAEEVATEVSTDVSADTDDAKKGTPQPEPAHKPAHVTVVPPEEIPELGTPFKLPNPSGMNVADYEEKLFEFLNAREYQKLGWLSDKSMRDTGPFLDGKYYGTHPAVRVYYSPGVIEWLAAGRVGKIPDGEMIIKEQYAPPAARHEDKTDEELWELLQSWTIMVKDSAGSHDGWYWGNPVRNCCVIENHEYPFDHPISGFGHYCVRCHASTQSPNATSPSENNEFTFIALRNIKGFPGEPLLFRVDDSWRVAPEKKIDLSNENLLSKIKKKEETSHPKCTQTAPPERVDPLLNKEFVSYYSDIDQRERESLLHIPPVTHDWVNQHSGGHAEFMTSNQCMSCHAGLTLPYGPSMFQKVGTGDGYGEPGWNISPHGEWRWTPMGLAGRDPVFYAQLESELAILEKEFGKDPNQLETVTSNLQATCLRCHGAMGKHQFDIDHTEENLAARKNGDEEKVFSLKEVYAKAEGDEHLGHGHSKYGALARDGISCMICHRAQPRLQPADDERSYLEFFLETSITGNMHFGPPNELYGPYKDDEISPYVMEHATKIKPKHSEYIQSSQMCGTCHTVNLPIVDEPFRADETDMNSPERVLANAEGIDVFKDFHHHVEQATYLEWLNSEFENEFDKDNPNAKSCQDCHMSKGLKDERFNVDVPKISTRIAAIQDTTYPDAENLVSHKELNIRVRDDYSRHNFSGLNVFLLELFQQYDDVLGVRRTDFMTGGKDDLGNAIESMLMQAKYDTASLKVDTKLDERKLSANVLVSNKAGHRFPSGVGFRRAFLELLVVEEPKEKDGEERIVWSSGRTNGLGVLLGEDKKPLPTESFEIDKETGTQSYQPHHEIITSPNQVQVYETLLWNHAGEFTTSFVHGCVTIKDNRLLPRGWKKDGPDPSLKDYFLRATWPGKDAINDPRYTDSSGTDETTYQITLPENVDPERVTVRATLYYQAMPPYFLQSLFKTAPAGKATQRLHHMLSNMRLDGTPIKDWKLPVVSSESRIE